MPNQIKCQQCGGRMVKKVQSSGNCLGIAIALLLVAVGILLCLTIWGAIIGVPLIICALFVGGKRQKVWRCVKCRAIVPRG